MPSIVLPGCALIILPLVELADPLIARPWPPMTDDEAAELELLPLATRVASSRSVLAAPCRSAGRTPLKRLQERDWIRLIDVTPIELRGPKELFRVFLLTASGLAFLKRHAS